MLENNNLLYNKNFEHDACGIGAVVNIDGKKSYKTVDDALKIVEKLQHRAGKDAMGEVGDGVGILVQIPHEFFINYAKTQNFSLPKEGDYAVAMIFFDKEESNFQSDKESFEKILTDNNLKVLSWRKVDINPSILKGKAISSMPNIYQCIIEKPENLESGIVFERKLYSARKIFEKQTKSSYVVTMSSKTIVYKGLLLVEQLREFYLDLKNQDFKSAIALVHSRFSTNTFPSWERAHPNRMILHNGEINTIRGNADRMVDRQEELKNSLIQMKGEDIYPIINVDGSDSAMLDNTIEFLYLNGMEIQKAMTLCVPEPWKNDKYMEIEKKNFYNYNACMMEPWDGPAAILFTDGDTVGATLDRNGLRPSRYYITKDNNLILSSEVGVLDIDEDKIVQKSRIEPGKMLIVDTKQKKIILDSEVKKELYSKNAYGEWLDLNLIHLKDLKIPNKKLEYLSEAERYNTALSFGYSYEDIKNVILPYAQKAIEPISSMGIDIPLAFLSEKGQPLFSYFKQKFAQVTNPPLDSLREKSVTATNVFLGRMGNLLVESDKNCRVLEIDNPILTGVDILKLKNQQNEILNCQTVSMLFNAHDNLTIAIENMLKECDKKISLGANTIILSDRGVNENLVAIPSLLAVSALSTHLKSVHKSTEVSIVCESGEPRTVHHFALLLGFGAKAINPYLVHEFISEAIDKKVLDKDYHTAIDDYNYAILHGIVKISAKMGVSTIQSYQASQIFEIIGLSKEVTDKYFKNTDNQIGGVDIDKINSDTIKRHHNAYFNPNAISALPSLGVYKYLAGEEKEEHLYNPKTILALQNACQKGDYSKFKEFSDMVNNQMNDHAIRNLLDFNLKKAQKISIDEVESVSDIVKRFKTGAMSYGSISQEAHECMAIAMNRLGGKSNSGEGGENSDRFNTEKCSSIKQVASGRFGVTLEYLKSAKEIQIKMAQGAKPGEGGHLPGSKVYPWIAKTRHATTGVDLISPPPHHDIYSIEDLAQLCYDLKNANKNARISVKLVSKTGVGTVATGVAKTGAEVILISGFDGGTGAAPQTSIHDAGMPWELGLAETHQTLLLNNMRHKVVLETDGKLMTGRDVVIACLLGAEEFGFATAPLVTMGCMMMRVCNLDVCPVGVATQNERLRKCFKGKPEYVMNFMMFVAQEVREIMANLGVRTIDELVGQTQLLKEKEKVEGLDLSKLLNKVESKIDIMEKVPFDYELEKTIDQTVLIPTMIESIKDKKACEINVDVKSKDRTFATLLGSQIEDFDKNCQEGKYKVNCFGGAGQSFGAFIPKGLELNLVGDANDYLGKGLSGGIISVKKSESSCIKASENVIIGNVALYGATSGEVYINGKAGERFCVRNSGAIAVVEGCGDHGLEYMTGGVVAILGDVGKNFSAGMSGGIAFCYDKKHTLYKHLNKQLIYVKEVLGEYAISLKSMLEKHVEKTNSEKAKEILENFEAELKNFKMIIPKKYSKVIEVVKEQMKLGKTRDQAELIAFEKSLKMED